MLIIVHFLPVLQDRMSQLKLVSRRHPDAPQQLLILPIFAALQPEQQMRVRGNT